MGGPGIIDAVLFDFDGTLFHLALDLSDFRKRWGAAGQTVGQILGSLAGRDLDLAIADLDAAEMRGVAQGAAAAGAAEVLAGIALSRPVAVVSRNSRKTVEAGLAVMDVRGVLVVGREDAAAAKPAPDPIRLAMSRLGAAQGLMVGDTSHDVTAAAEAGLGSVVVHNPGLAQAPKNADYYVQDVRAVARLLEEI